MKFLARLGGGPRPRHPRPGWIVLGALLLIFACAANPGLTPGPAPDRPTSAAPAPFPAGPEPREQAERACTFTGVPKIVAVGDLHGAYEAFRNILKFTGIIDEKDHWAGGKNHLVQLGDIMDRGENPKEIFDLIRKLEPEALAAGGRVHMLVGNHEEMNILEQSFEFEGFITVGQFKSFLSPKTIAAAEKKFRAKAGPNAELEPYWKDFIKNNDDARAEYSETFIDNYGTWIIEHNAVVKINEVLFVHGGLSEGMSNYSCDQINKMMTREFNRWLGGDHNFVGRVVHAPRGPLWYRELANGDETILKAEVDRILKNQGARALVIAHTPTAGSVSLSHLDRFDKKVWIIDTGIWMETGGAECALIIENGNIPQIMTKDGIIETGNRQEPKRGP